MRSSALLLIVLAPTGILSYRVSRDATCGGQKGYTCLGSAWGDCCSKYGWCGSDVGYCGIGCNPAFGTCHKVTVSKPPSSLVKTTNTAVPVSSPSQRVTTDARCGPSFGDKTCLGSRWGGCCSQYSYCGSTIDYCAANTCQRGYGKCNTLISSQAATQTSTFTMKSSSASSSFVSSSSAAIPPSTIIYSSSSQSSSTTTPSTTSTPSSRPQAVSSTETSSASSSPTLFSETLSASSTVSSTFIISSSTSSTSSPSPPPSPTCPAGQTLCGSQCLDLSSDPNNCGTCGQVCNSGSCQQGLCITNSCTGQTCDTFSACGPGGSCVCASLQGGAGVCADGQTPCASLANCVTSADCPAGVACAVGTCCTRNVCIPVNAFCGNSASPSRLFVRRQGRGKTIAG